MKIKGDIVNVEQLIQKTNGLIAGLEEEKAKLGNKNTNRLKEITVELRKHQQKIAELEAKWLILQTELEQSHAFK